MLNIRALVYYDPADFEDDIWDLSSATFRLMAFDEADPSEPGYDLKKAFTLMVSHDLFDPSWHGLKDEDDNYPAATLFELAVQWMEDNMGSEIATEGALSDAEQLEGAEEAATRIKAVVDLALAHVKRTYLAKAGKVRGDAINQRKRKKKIP